MGNKYSLITLFLFFVAASAGADTTKQSTTGDQSPVINAGRDANVIYNITNVNKFGPEIAQAITQAITQELKKQGIPASEYARELKILTAKYQELMQQLAEYESQDELVKQARAALSKGKLDKAEKLLQQAEARETALFEQRQQRIAERNYELAQISELKFEYQTAIQRYRKTVKFAPEKLQAWYDLAAIYDRTGDSKQALETWKSLLKHASGQNNDSWRAWSRIKIGDVLAKQGFSKQAVSEYQQAQQLFAAQLKDDPKNSGWQRDLSVSYDRIGDMHKNNGDGDKAIQAYQDGLTIAETLARRDPKNSGWQRDLSVSYDQIGDMHKSNGDGDKAIQAYQDGLTIRETLARRDPKNSRWQRDLSVSYNNLGDMHKNNGDGDKAIQAYQDGLTIHETLARRDSKRADWQRDMIVSYVKMSQVIPEKQKHYLQQALSIVLRLDKESRLYPDDRWMIKSLRDQLESL